MRKSTDVFGMIGLPFASRFAGRFATTLACKSGRMCSQRFCILLYVLSIMYALYAFGPLAAPMSSASQHQKVPEVEAWLVEEKLTFGGARSEKFHITVQIPSNHHAYLDKGDDGLLIPLTFTFTPLEQQGIQVVLHAQPGGKRDEEFRATVLRGEGTFVFQVKATREISPLDSVLPATLRHQICNDVTKICYPPKEIEVPIRFTGQ